jgi:hypothetical protein
LGEERRNGISIGTWSGFHTPYSEAEVRKYAPTSAGVYLLWVNYKSGKWGCFYVGRADNIKTRLLNHGKPEEPNKCVKEDLRYKCGFMWIDITTEEERSGAEKYLYDTLKPECNQNDPGGKALKIPLPPTPLATTPPT